MIPFTNLHQQYLLCKTEIDEAIAESIRASSYITGPDVSRFETEFSHMVGSADCASTGSCTTAMLCALRALDIGPGDEVLTTPHTFVSTTEVIVSVGATPVFVDIDPDTHMIDLDLLEQHMTSRTRAVLFVDIYGQCPDMNRLHAICYQYGLHMIEDAAHSLGNHYNGRMVGSLSDITCFSFNPVKNLGAMGDLGCVTGSVELMEKIRMYRDHGRTGRYNIEQVGYNCRSDNLQTNIVLAKMHQLQPWLNRKREICAYYTDQLKHLVHVPSLIDGNTHSYYVYVIQTDRRNELQDYLKQQEIQTNIHYATTTHTQPAYRNWYRPCPVAERTVNEILSLPSWIGMTDQQVEQVADAVKGFFK
jgi:dTDP-4-amino-4,6-dideoxygalactose transaminase